MNHLLSWIIFLPMVGSIALLLTPSAQDKTIRIIGLATTLVTFALSLVMFCGFDLNAVGYQFVEKCSWIPTYGIQYHIGVDGMSMLLMVLTTLLTVISLVSSRDSVKERLKEFILSILLLETAMLGTFASLDVFFFYIFWELMLIPMFILIGVFGGARRIYATLKFFLYTAFGSLLMLAGFIALYTLHYQQTGVHSTALADLLNVNAPLNLQLLLFMSFFLAFAIKVPLFPFHTWLPDAHVEAPTAGSVILAGVLLKMGGYGLIRFAIPLFPIAAEVFAPSICILAVIGIIYGALMCFRQEDIKKLIAYSSVSHMGFVVLGIFSFQSIGVSGAVFQMIAHGLTTGALFLMIGMIYDRKHTRQMKDYGGIAKTMPRYTVLFFIVTMGAVGLPGLCGFVGEFMILMGSFQSPVLHNSYLYTAFAVVGVVLGAGYMLMMFERVFLGKDPHNNTMKDLTTREGVYMLALIVGIVWFGIQPNFVLKYLNPKIIVSSYENQFQPAKVAAPQGESK
jgi:NADH-quinone oxidoreductase subunit M